MLRQSGGWLRALLLEDSLIFNIPPVSAALFLHLVCFIFA